MAKKSFAVIGLGQFGRSIVEELVDNGRDVIAIDSDKEAVRKIAPILSTFLSPAVDQSRAHLL